MSDKAKTKALPFILLAVGILALLVGYILASATKEAPPAPYTPPVESAATPNAAQQALDSSAAQEVRPDHPAPDLPDTAPQPKVQAEGRFLGAKNAPVKMIEFSSLTCSHCAHFHNAILDSFRVKYVDTGLVQIEFRDFPLNKPALDAAKILHCLPGNQYFPFMSMLFQTQNHWAFTADYLVPLRQNAKLAGMSDVQVDSCLNDAAAEKKMAEGIQKDAEKYKLESTPTFIINDGAAKISGALPLSEFAKAIDPLLPPSDASKGKTAP